MANEADVWTLSTADADLGLYETYLDEFERARQQRYLRSQDQLLFVAAHGFLREILGRYLEIAPGSVAFSIGRHGKPVVEGIEFNMSHTKGLVGVVVSESHPCGIDVESLDSVDDVGLVARTSMTTYEQADISKHAEPERRFYEHWTLKEAYIKARGAGLALPLDRFGFEIDLEPILRVEPPIVDDPSTWTFEMYRASRDHQLAVAVRGALVRIRRL